MSSLFARVFRQARITFEQTAIGDAKFAGHLNTLRHLLGQLTLADLNLDPSLVATETFQQPTKAPCTFVDVYENDRFAISVFVLRENYTMPLHDHPSMHGLLRVISGAVQIRSYTELARRDSVTTTSSMAAADGVLGSGSGTAFRQRHVLVAAEPEKIISSSVGAESCALLTPDERNYHEITAIGGPAAFFDILSPPYNTNQPQHISFYRKVPVPRHLAEVELGSPGEEKPLAPQPDDDRPRYVLESIPNPENYYCDTVEYEPPDFLYTDDDADRTSDGQRK